MTEMPSVDLCMQQVLWHGNTQPLSTGSATLSTLSPPPPPPENMPQVSKFYAKRLVLSLVDSESYPGREILDIFG